MMGGSTAGRDVKLDSDLLGGKKGCKVSGLQMLSGKEGTGIVSTSAGLVGLGRAISRAVNGEGGVSQRFD